MFAPSRWQTNTIATLGIGAVLEHIIIGQLGGWLSCLKKGSSMWLESIVAKVSAENSTVKVCGGVTATKAPPQDQL